MKRVWAILLALSVVCTAADAQAFSDATYREFLETSENFRKADERLNKAYKSMMSSLPKEHQSLLRGEQRYWIKTRHLESLRHMSPHTKWVDACAKEVRERAEYIERWIAPGVLSKDEDHLTRTRRRWQCRAYMDGLKKQATYDSEISANERMKCLREQFVLGADILLQVEEGQFPVWLARDSHTGEFIAVAKQHNTRSVRSKEGLYYYHPLDKYVPYTAVLDDGTQRTVPLFALATSQDAEKLCPFSGNKYRERYYREKASHLLTVQRHMSSYDVPSGTVDPVIEGQYTNGCSGVRHFGFDVDNPDCASGTVVHIQKRGDEHNVKLYSYYFRTRGMGGICQGEFNGRFDGNTFHSGGLTIQAEDGRILLDISKEARDRICDAGHYGLGKEELDKNYILDLYDALEGNW